MLRRVHSVFYQLVVKDVQDTKKKLTQFTMIGHTVRLTINLSSFDGYCCHHLEMPRYTRINNNRDIKNHDEPLECKFYAYYYIVNYSAPV